MHPIDLSCHQNFEKNSPTRSGRSWKIWKSHGRLDSTLRMCEAVHVRSIEFPRVRNDPPSTRTYSLWKEDIFPLDRLMGHKKSNQNQFGRVFPFAFAFTCHKIHLFFPSISNFDSFRWRVNLSCPLTPASLLQGLTFTESPGMDTRSKYKWHPTCNYKHKVKRYL